MSRPHLVTAKCQCRGVEVRICGEPVRVSVCHCLECQKRSGSAFSAQVRFRRADVEIEGELREFVRIADSVVEVPQYFCPVCGNGIMYFQRDEPDLIALPVGLFSEDIGSPATSVWERRKRAWVDIIAPAVEHREV